MTVDQIPWPEGGKPYPAELESVETFKGLEIRFRPIKMGTYTLRIDAISGQGPYFVDLSCDAAPAAQVLKR